MFSGFHNSALLASASMCIYVCACVCQFTPRPFCSIRVHRVRVYLSIRVLPSARAHTPIYPVRFLPFFVHVYVSVTGYLLYPYLVYIRYSFL